jgi:PKD repeat protein
MNCHRQETSGLPNTNGTCTGFSATNQGACVAGGGSWADSGGGLPVTVGPYHSTVTFPSHMHANQYLNSPHGLYTGTFNGIPSAPFAYGGPNAFTSVFVGGSDADLVNQGGGCTTCHNVHLSTNELANPNFGGGAVKQCNDCHHKNLAVIKHPSGPNTPLYDVADPVTACAKCHMPGGDHLFRINTNASNSQFPLPAAITANTAANTSADGAYTNAVWEDLNTSCGSCHGGNNWDGSIGSQAATNVATTGSITSGSAVLTVASSAGFFPNEAIRVSGAYSYNGLVGGVATWADLNSFIKSVDSPTQITLAGTASHTVIGAAVMQDAPTGASWYPKSTLMTYAIGIHNDAPAAAFTASYGATAATINVDASLSTCSGSLSNCNAFAWNWGDGTAAGSGVTASHTYAAAGTYTITLTVTQYGFDPGIATRSVNAYVTDNPPVTAGSCSINYATWIASCSNTSTDDHGIALASINWGDGTVVSNITGLGTGPFTHTFLLPNTYAITLAVVDTAGQMGPLLNIGNTVASSFQFFTISGTVTKNDGVTGIGAAQIQFLQGGVIKRSVTSTANGTFNSGNMKPGTYNVKITRMGYTFTNPPNVTIGPNVSGLLYKAN